MTLKNFSVGMNTRLHPTLLQTAESIEYLNCDNEAGILQPIREPIPTNMIAGNYYLVVGNDTLTSSTPEYWVRYNDRIYTASHSYDVATLTEKPLREPAPTNVVGLQAGNDGTLNGVYKYRYTYYDSTDGRESAPSESAELEVEDKQIEIDSLVPNTNVDKIRIYRLGGNLLNYTLVGTIDSSLTIYTDTQSDIDIAGNDTLTTLGLTVIEGLKYLTETHAIFFGAIDNKLYFSDIGTPDRWREESYLVFDDIITGIGATQHGVLVFTRYKTYIVTGNNPSVFSKYLLSNSQGCIKHETIAFVDNMLIWLSMDGVCMSSGGNITVVTHDKLGKWKDYRNIVNAVVVDKVYYLATNDYTWAVDFRYSPNCIRQLSNGGYLATDEDTLYCNIEDTVYEMSPRAGTYRKLRYVSPIFTLGRYSELKHFKDFYIMYSGTIRIRLRLDETTVLDKTLSSVTPTHFNYKSVGDRDGYGLQVHIEGVGKVYELDFTAVGRENAK